MKKLYIGFMIFFIIYLLFISLYLFNAEQDLPAAYQNSPADPATFMSEEQLQTATVYSRTKDFLYFAAIPYEWAVLLIILGFGLSTSFYIIAKKISKRSLFLQTTVYVFLITLLLTLLKLPLQYLSYKVSTDYGISIQPFDLWLIDKWKSFLVDFVLTVPMVWLLYTLIRKSPKRWWFWYWLVSIPFIILLFFAQPVIIDPIFNDFEYLQDEELKKDILSLADTANIPADQVYQVNMSEKTTAMNAYVTGIGSNARIVLWDTTLSKLNRDEILFIMAHEMAHYVYKHIYWMMFGMIVLFFFMFYIGYRIVNWAIKRYGHYWDIGSVGDLNSLPLILLVLSILFFAVTPVENSISRASERAADAYAIRITQNPEAAISSFQKLTIDSLSEPNPPQLVKVFKYSHPTISERIYTISKELE